MQAIITRFLPATNRLGSRIKAQACKHSLTISYPYGENTGNAHRMAAEQLAAKLEWVGEPYGELIGGGTETGFAFVFSKSMI